MTRSEVKTPAPGWADSEAVIQALAALRRYSDARAQGKPGVAFACLDEAESTIHAAKLALSKELKL